MTEINKTEAENQQSSAKKEVLPASKKDKKNKTSDTLKQEAKVAQGKVAQEKVAQENAAKKDDVTKEKTTETASNTEPQIEHQNKAATQNMAANTYQPKEKRSGFGLSLLAISMVLVFGGGIYYLGLQQSNRLNAKIDSLNSQISSLNSQVSSLKGELQQNNAIHKAADTQAKEERGRLQILITQQENSLTSMQNALIELKGRRPSDWLLAEADHLVKQAGRQLWIEKDIVTTTRLIETADQRIAQLNDPSLTPIRQAMANDLQVLKSIERIDSDGIILRISSLQNQVNSLTLANALLAQEMKEQEPKVVSEEISNWKENLFTSLKDFAGEFITYRKREGTVVPLLTPAQTFYLQENVKAKLAQAINAVYRENTELYLTSLATAKQWINDFYHLEMPETQAFIQSIDELEKQTIKVNYPTKLDSLNLISDELSQRLSKELAALVVNEVNIKGVNIKGVNND